MNRGDREYFDEEGEPLELPRKWVICDRCAGEGTHVNPNIDGHGITAEEWENDWDEESRETYMRGGYDVPCHDCGGSGKLRVVDLERCTDDVRKLVEEQDESDAEIDAIYASERRMGA